jgi:glucan endo-1,3-alpha-glucosidase
MTDTQDELYLGFTAAAGKQYMAPVSPWCGWSVRAWLMIVSTHFGKEVPYSKNWVFYSETLWKDRWDQILKMGSGLNFIESE